MITKKQSNIFKVFTTVIALALYTFLKIKTSFNPVIGILIPVYLYFIIMYFANKKDKTS
ncbi:hypothetical protein [Clostridium senegalense]